MHHKEHIWTMVMVEICKHTFYSIFVRNLKIDAIYAFYPESFCNKNLAIRKVFAFCDSGRHLCFFTMVPAVDSPCNSILKVLMVATSLSMTSRSSQYYSKPDSHLSSALKKGHIIQVSTTGVLASQSVSEHTSIFVMFGTPPHKSTQKRA